jgi:uncharacterized protein with gpF-like domain
MNGLVRPAKDSIWRTFYPPSGFSCRCRVRSLSQTDMERYNLKETPKDKLKGLKPDEGFETSPIDWKPNTKGYSPDIQKQLDKALNG